LPLLYLHGLSSSDFGPALEEFLGSDQGLSAATITRLTVQWQDEARAFNARSLAATDCVYTPSKRQARTWRSCSRRRLVAWCRSTSRCHPRCWASAMSWSSRSSRARSRGLYSLVVRNLGPQAAARRLHRRSLTVQCAYSGPRSLGRALTATASQSRRCRVIASGLARTQHGRRQAWICRKDCPDTEPVACVGTVARCVAEITRDGPGRGALRHLQGRSVAELRGDTVGRCDTSVDQLITQR